LRSNFASGKIVSEPSADREDGIATLRSNFANGKIVSEPLANPKAAEAVAQEF
jgi:hypothetical protein